MNSENRILQIGLSKGYGGIESFVMTYFRELQKEGVLFDFADLYGEGLAYSDEIQKLGGRIYTLTNYKKHPGRCQRELRQLIRQNGYRCAHIHMLSAANLLPMRVCTRMGLKTIVHSHNTSTVGIVRKVLHKLNAPALEKSDTVKCACGTEAGRWMFGEKEFVVIPNAVNFEAFRFDSEARSKTRSELGIREEVLLGFVGRLTEVKNVSFLISLMRQLQEISSNYRMIIIGTGELESALKEATVSAGLQKEILFLGRKNDIPRHLSAMDIFCLPSFFEGFSISTVEAQASGVSCLLSDRMPKEVAILDNVRFQGISNTEQWVTAVKDFDLSVETRKQQSECFENSAYNIKNSLAILKGVYTS